MKAEFAGNRRWIVLGEDGRHATLGRASAPTADELAAAEAALVAQALSGWLAVMGGEYWRRRARLSLFEVQPMASPASAFSKAVAAFEARRAASLAEARQAA